MITPEDLQPTIETLEGIINSAAHPDIAIRAVMVELKPIRNEVKRLKSLVERLNEWLKERDNKWSNLS